MSDGETCYVCGNDTIHVATAGGPEAENAFQLSGRDGVTCMWTEGGTLHVALHSPANSPELTVKNDD